MLDEHADLWHSQGIPHDHRGVVMSDPVAALTDLQLGRAYVLLGDKTKAKSAYQDFLVVWKDADAEIPVLKQAKAEYSKVVEEQKTPVSEEQMQNPLDTGWLR